MENIFSILLNQYGTYLLFELLALASNITMKTITKQSRIAIIGAGISGLSLAIALTSKGFTQIKILQKDNTIDERRQGYGLTILQGKSALKTLGVLQDVKKCNAPSRTHYIFNEKGQILGFYGPLFWDSTNQSRSVKSKQKGLSMHIPRQDLRKILAQKAIQLLPSSSLLWSHTLNNIQFSLSNLKLSFQNKNSLQADLTIGCDGIYSNLRMHSVTKDSELKYLGIMVVLGLCGYDHPLTKQRVFQTADGNGRLFVMPFINKESSLRSMWQFSIKIDESSAKFYSKNPQQLKQYVYTLLKDWHQPIPNLIQNTSVSNIMGIAAYDRDPELSVMIDDRVILIGDAAHPMSPFKGQGANQALLDATELAEVLQKQSFEQVSRFKQRMFERVKSKVLLSRQRANKYHCPNFVSVDNFLYPRIDKQLIQLIKDNKIDANKGDLLEDQILALMKKNNYLK